MKQENPINGHHLCRNSNDRKEIGLWWENYFPSPSSNCIFYSEGLQTVTRKIINFSSIASSEFYWNWPLGSLRRELVIWDRFIQRGITGKFDDETVVCDRSHALLITNFFSHSLKNLGLCGLYKVLSQFPVYVKIWTVPSALQLINLYSEVETSSIKLVTSIEIEFSVAGHKMLLALYRLLYVKGRKYIYKVLLCVILNSKIELGKLRACSKLYCGI